MRMATLWRHAADNRMITLTIAHSEQLNKQPSTLGTESQAKSTVLNSRVQDLHLLHQSVIDAAMRVIALASALRRLTAMVQP